MKSLPKFLRKPRHALDYESLLEIWQAVNALRNARMGGGGQVFVTDSNTVYMDGGGSGQMTYKGEWTAGGTYAVQNIVTRGVLGEFIAVQAPPAGTAPETGAPYWHAWQYPPPGVWQ